MVLHSAMASKKAFAHTPIRRMNRFQYNNAVKDLFQLKVSVFPLPERMLREYGDYFQPAKRKMPDKVRVGSRPLGKSQLIEPRLVGVDPFPQDLRAEHGFDNQGNHLSLSPLADGSLSEAQQIGAGKQEFRPERPVVSGTTFFVRTQRENSTLPKSFENACKAFLWEEPSANRSLMNCSIATSPTQCSRIKSGRFLHRSHEVHRFGRSRLPSFPLPLRRSHRQ